MDHFREIRNTLTWHNEGKFEVTLINGVITKLNFCEPGKGPQDTGKCLNSTDYKFLRNVYTSLGELFAFIDEENKRLGYKYSRELTETPYVPLEEVTEEYMVPAEAKLRVIDGVDGEKDNHQPIGALKDQKSA
jgi:hypothetical protein